MHLRLKQSDLSDEEKDAALGKIADAALEKGVAVAVSGYIRDEEEVPPVPSIRVVSFAPTPTCPPCPTTTASRHYRSSFAPVAMLRFNITRPSFP